MSTKYYIYSHKWTKGFNRTFWMPRSNGYTMNLDEAGQYEREEHPTYPVWLGENKSVLHELCRKHDNILIPVEKIENLGKKMTTILN